MRMAPWQSALLCLILSLPPSDDNINLSFENKILYLTPPRLRFECLITAKQCEGVTSDRLGVILFQKIESFL